jgi:2'-5' RNA ligase
MKFLTVFFSFFGFFGLGFSLVSCQSQSLKSLSNSRGPQGAALSLEGEHVKFEKHPDYLVMTLPRDAVSHLLPAIESQENVKLISRNESHITVITPPEFAVLKTHLSIGEIDEIAERWEIQKSEIQPVCIGGGRANVNGHEERAYFVVVQAENLLSIRRAIRDLFVERGGDNANFNADHFYPHITIGFTKQDIHEQNGVIKTAKSCLWSL